jgi:DNA mismatch repair protein MutL
VPEIKILPEILSNKIAAGEVVERPASVVKELVENALDADGDRIVISVEKGGRALIQVADNGTGMAADDALLSIERYATSKIYDDKDLFAIGTLGFRGEALPSIASVSRFVLETRKRDADIGLRVEMSGGTLGRVTEVGAPPGTLVAVRDLFFNTPARRKFLKSTATEMSHISEAVANAAIGWPRVAFTLRHDGREVKSWPAANDPADRVADVLGRGVGGGLQPVSRENGGVAVSGWIAGPDDSRATSRGIYLYVNGRCIRDRMIQHALVAGFRGRLMKGRFPVAVLFVTVPPDRVDVNVHPAKNEVRFSDQQQVHRTIEAAVAGALMPLGQSGWRSGADAPTGVPAATRIETTTAGAPESPPDPQPPKPAEPPLSASLRAPAAVAEPAPDFRPADDAPDLAPRPAPVQTPVWERRLFRDLSVIGQFRETYILCESDDNLIIIDQHAAHERIYFEQLRFRASRVRQASQRLLIPETFELNWREAEVLEPLIPAFASVGIDVEPFSGRTVAVTSLPGFLLGKPAAPMIIEILEKAVDIGVAAGIDKIVEESLMVVACHGAIRAHRRLSGEEIRHLLAQLDACENPSNCPHGRPTWIKWTARFLEKTFHRIV